MTSYFDLKDYFLEKKYHLIIASDAQPFVHKKNDGKVIVQVPAGGVSVALEPVARAAHATFIARGRTEEDKKAADEKGYFQVKNGFDDYMLHRLFLTEEETDNYYLGFCNQTLWPLCHIAYEQPIFNPLWWQSYVEVNQKFAKAIEKDAKDPTFIWINDYQLSLVPGMLASSSKHIVGLFWHIPWPTWEIFRILPQKKQILESLLSCDFLAFHRKYQADNFLDTLRRELEVRIDPEKNTVHYKNHQTTVQSLPMGIDTDILTSLAQPEDTVFLTSFVRNMLGIPEIHMPMKEFFKTNQVLLGVDRLDYTKGLLHRLRGLWRFFEKYPKYKEKVTYVGFMASSRDKISSYKKLRSDLEGLAHTINQIFGTPNWKPIQLAPGIFSRHELVELYKYAAECLVTPLDDGMNLVSKEYIIASSLSPSPGMLILSQFAGSAKDLNQALLINPYDPEELADAIAKGLSMSQKERTTRIHQMAKILNEHNVYSWALNFLRDTQTAAMEHRKITFG